MNHTLTFCWRNKLCSERINRVQQELFTSCVKFGIYPILYVDDDRVPKFGDILKSARQCASKDGWMGYVNSDCVLQEDPWKYINDRIAYGFHRIEMPSKERCLGVDMYILPIEIWDNYLSKDIPDMHVGVTHIDWWLTRAMQKMNQYKAIDNVITHESHPKVSGEGVHPLAEYNVNEYNKWADRNQISKV